MSLKLTNGLSAIVVTYVFTIHPSPKQRVRLDKKCLAGLLSWIVSMKMKREIVS